MPQKMIRVVVLGTLAGCFSLAARAEPLTLHCTFPNGATAQAILDYDKGIVTYFDSESPSGTTSVAQITSARITWRQSEFITGEQAVVSYYLDRITGELGYQYSTPKRGQRGAKSNCVKAERKF